MGFKVFLLCDSFQGYVYKFNFFKGGTDYYPYNITMELVTGLEHLNIHLTVDNWYSSIKLIEDLLVIKGITTTCTMKKNATGMPTDFKIASKSLRINESIFWQKKRMILSAYRDKAIVGCISTLAVIEILSKIEKEKSKA